MIEKPTNVLVLPDIHIRKKAGGEDKRSLDAVLKYASENKWSHVIQLGDIMDNNSISSHNIGNLRAASGETVLGDYQTANAFLDRLEQATPGAIRVLIEGNHDYRSERLVDVQPSLKGLVETQHGLRLRARGWLWVPYWSEGTTYDLGKASFGHGRYTNQHHAFKHATRYGRNFYYGHIHDCQEYTMERDGDDLKYEAASLGCLCSYRQYYMKGRPNRWQQAFGVFRFQANGNFNRYTVRIFDHKFTSPEGQFYRG